jgi:hypothetical protein
VPHGVGVARDLAARRLQIVAGGDEAQRPQRQISLHFALGDPLHRHVAVAEPGAREAVADQPAGGDQREREEQGMDDCG